MRAMATERTFWRFVAGTLSVGLILCVAANWVRKEAVPHQITLLLFGSLVALGVARAIVNPRSSPVILAEHEEARFRRTQYVVGLAFSSLLSLVLALTELRESVMVWLLAPIIVLPFALVIRERVKRK